MRKPGKLYWAAIGFVGIFAASLVGRDISSVGPRTEAIERQAYQKVFYVSLEKGSDKDGDGSLDKPWQTLTGALAKLPEVPEGQRYAVFVAAGHYASGTIIMRAGVDLFGGFCPQTWQRDIFKYRTILDGLISRRVVVAADRARLDGFVILHGLARSHGGGILCGDVSPTISNNFIVENRALEPEAFDHHHIHQPGHHGGGIACLYNAVPVIRNNLIAGNSTGIGGGAGVAFYGWRRLEGGPQPKMDNNYLVGGLQPLLQDNVIVGNVAGVNDLQRTRSSSGGGIYCGYEARPIIRNNVIIQNRALGRSDAGGIYSEYYSYPLIEDNWIVGNVCEDDGGGIYAMRCGQALIRANFIAGNRSLGGGVGGIRLSKEGRARMVNNIIVHNQSGGGVNITDSYAEMEDNIIRHNIGGGLTYIQNFSYLMPSRVRGNIVRDNFGQPIILGKDQGQPLQVVDNNLDESSWQGNVNIPLQWVDEAITCSVRSIAFDTDSYTTTVFLERKAPNLEQTVGRVLRLGDRWSVIVVADDHRIVVWGDVRGADKSGEILSSYQCSPR